MSDGQERARDGAADVNTTPTLAPTPQRRAGGRRLVVLALLLVVVVVAVVVRVNLNHKTMTRGFQRAMQAIGSADSLSLKAHYLLTSQLMGGTQKVDMSIVAAYAKPNRLRWTVTQNGIDNTAVSDGKTVWISLPSAHTLVKSPAPPDLASLRPATQFSAIGRIDHLPTPDGLLAGFEPQSIKTFRPGVHTSSDWLADQQGPKGSYPFTVTLTDGSSALFWINLRNGSLAGVAADLSGNAATGNDQDAKSTKPKGPAAIMQQMMKASKVHLICTFDEFRANSNPPADTFAFTPPKGEPVKIVNDVRDVLGAVTGGLLRRVAPGAPPKTQ